MSVQDFIEKAGTKGSKDQAIDTEDMVMKPRVHVREPDEYHMPQEMYVKKLINSPIEFGTVMIPVEMEDGEYPDHLHDPPEHMKQGWVQHFEIDIAMHAHLGAMVCGLVDADRQTSTGLEYERKILEERRQLLLKELDRKGHFKAEHLQSVGLFITAPGGDKEILCKEWNGHDVQISTVDDDVALYEQLIAAMKECGDDQFGPEDWQYFVAEVRSLGEDYTTALGWLRIYDLL